VAQKIDNVPREVFDASKSERQKYQDLVVGQPGWWALLRHELIIVTASQIPGALGLFLRSKLYPLLLGECGRNVFFGANITLRHPHKIRIGHDVVIDDGCVLDAKGSTNRGITIGNGVFLGRQTSINTKDGDIVLEDGVNLGAFCMVFSASQVRCGMNTLIAAYTYLVGGGHDMTNTDAAIIDQERPSAGITIGPNGWIGTGVSILDGVTLGHDVVIGANSVVTKDVDDFAVAAGSPAVIRRVRQPVAASG
jgi:acetyltransferase-like isoleucine patch superfamily enzyme